MILSAIHPLGAAGSPFFSSLPLSDHGLEWIHSPAPLGHPLDDGTAVMLERDLGDTKAALGADGEIWVKLAVGVHLASSLSVPKGHAPSGKAIFPVKTGVP